MGYPGAWGHVRRTCGDARLRRARSRLSRFRAFAAPGSPSRFACSMSSRYGFGVYASGASCVNTRDGDEQQRPTNPAVHAPTVLDAAVAGKTRFRRVCPPLSVRSRGFEHAPLAERVDASTPILLTDGLTASYCRKYADRCTLRLPGACRLSFEIRKFLAFSEKAAREAGVEPQQHS